MDYLIYSLLGLLVLVVVIILTRAALFKEKKEETTAQAFALENEEKPVENFCQMIKIPTISVVDRENGDYANHEKFLNLLKEKYPTIFEKCKFEQISKFGLLFILKGEKRDGLANLLMSHFDVVPVEEGKWKHNPFLGEVVDGCVYGRGTIDTKGTLVSIVEALEEKLKKGFVPRNDLYLTFGGDEEIQGHMQVEICKELEKRGLRFGLVLDEGGAIVKNIFPGVSKESAVIGVSEKGIANIEMIAHSSGGHASTPTKDNPAIIIASAMKRVEDHPMKGKVLKPVEEMLEIMGRNSKFVYKIIFANLWLFKGLVKKLFMKLSGETKALISTTFAFTTLEGSNSHNVLPQSAKCNINIRILNSFSVSDVLTHLKKVVNDDRVEFRVMAEFEPSPVASTKSNGYLKVKEALAETYPEIIISPYLMLAASDSRHYKNLTDTALKFAPFKLSKEERGTIHGNDERLSCENLLKGIEFYSRLIEKL